MQRTSILPPEHLAESGPSIDPGWPEGRPDASEVTISDEVWIGEFLYDRRRDEFSFLALASRRNFSTRCRSVAANVPTIARASHCGICRPMLMRSPCDQLRIGWSRDIVQNHALNLRALVTFSWRCCFQNRLYPGRADNRRTVSDPVPNNICGTWALLARLSFGIANRIA